MAEDTKFFDLQVNGYAGVDFNADGITPQQFSEACDRLRIDGVAGILATIITDDMDRMADRLSNIAAAREADRQIAEMIVGVHIEGPFLNEQPGYIGAHPKDQARLASREAMQRLLDAAAGLTRIVTLAPERDPELQVTDFLVQQGIVVSGGHCNPTLDQLHAAVDAGLSMFTHLGNGCPLQLHRHDNIIQRVLSLADQIRIGFIADGVHVPFFALKNYLKVAGIDRAFVVTDAIQAAGQGPGNYVLAGRQVVVDQNLATWAADRSHLIGSASTMKQVEKNLKGLGLSEEAIRRLTQINPRAAIA